MGFLESLVSFIRTGELMNRLSSDSQVIQNAVTVCTIFSCNLLIKFTVV